MPHLWSSGPEAGTASHSFVFCVLRMFCLRWILIQELSPESHFLPFQSLGLLGGGTNLQISFLLVIRWPVWQPLSIRVPGNRIKSKSSRLLCGPPFLSGLNGSVVYLSSELGNLHRELASFRTAHSILENSCYRALMLHCMVRDFITLTSVGLVTQI